jgi:Tfp pilus assembly protein PilO
MKKMSITVAILAAILLLALGWAWQWSRNIITIENASGKTVDAITVTVCGKSYRVLPASLRFLS